MTKASLPVARGLNAGVIGLERGEGCRADQVSAWSNLRTGRKSERHALVKGPARKVHRLRAPVEKLNPLMPVGAVPPASSGRTLKARGEEKLVDDHSIVGLELVFLPPGRLDDEAAILAIRKSAKAAA